MYNCSPMTRIKHVYLQPIIPEIWVREMMGSLMTLPCRHNLINHQTMAQAHRINTLTNIHKEIMQQIITYQSGTVKVMSLNHSCQIVCEIT